MAEEQSGPAAHDEAPPVVAVVVVRNPGPWFEEALGALAAQDYPALSVLVIDAGSNEDPTDRVAAAVPSAFVRRLSADPGFAAAADEVLDVVKGASHLLFCHDDVAPEPTCVRLLLEAAYRQNAGIVAPKLVEWERPNRLLSLGEGADSLGRLIPTVEPGELDQGQHDGEREVLAASSACLLIRADLFARLGGFDREIVLGGEDLDLCWRAACAGARTVTAPSARVRHRAALTRGERKSPLGNVRELAARHRLRAALVAAPGPFRLLATLAQAVITGILEAVTSVALGRRHRARTALGTVGWNVRTLRSTLASRRRLRRHRTGDSSDALRLVSRRGRFGAVVRDVAAEGDDRRTASQIIREGFATWWAGGIGRPILVLAGVAVVLAVGSRHLFGDPIPSVGTFAPLPDDPLELLRAYATGHRPAGLGGVGPAPAAFAVLGLAGVALLGATGLVSVLVVFGSLALGLVGAGRLARPLGSGRSTAAGVLVYAVVPLWYDALATGSMSGLVAYAVAPWVLLRLFRGSGLAPFGSTAAAESGVEGSALAEVARLRAMRRAQAHRPAPALAGGGQDLYLPDEPEERTSIEALSDTGAAHALDEMGAFADDIELADLGRTRARQIQAVRHQLSPPPVPERTSAQQAVALGVVLALAFALAPATLPAVAVALVGFVASGLLAGDVGAMRSGAVLAAKGAVVALALTFPWSVELLRSGQWSAVVGPARAPETGPSLYDLLRFSTGPLPVGPLPLLLLVAAALPLSTGRGWRWGWACRSWVIALVVWAVAFAWDRRWIPFSPPDPTVLLPFAAAALALAVALGAAAFEVDLPGYRFGLRQVACLVAGAAVVVAAAPVVVGGHTGRWSAPERSNADVLSWMADRAGEGPFRVLWAGDPAALPLTGWYIDDGVAFGTSRNGPPRATDEWAGPRRSADDAIGNPLGAARRREVVDLGHRLAPLGVRYIVVPLRTAPDHGRAARVPSDLTAGLADQVDLKAVETNPSVVVYENAAWIPARAQVPDDAVAVAARPDGDPSQVDLAAGEAVLGPRRPGSLTYKGPVAEGEVLLADAASARWSLAVAGRPAERHTAFGVVNSFSVPSPGQGTLRFATPLLHWLALALQAGLWVLALGVLVRSVGRATAGPAVARRPVALGPQPKERPSGGVVLLPRVTETGEAPGEGGTTSSGWGDLLEEPELDDLAEGAGRPSAGAAEPVDRDGGEVGGIVETSGSAEAHGDDAADGGAVDSADGREGDDEAQGAGADLDALDATLEDLDSALPDEPLRPHDGDDS